MINSPSNSVRWGCWTLVIHETLLPLSCGPEDLTDKINFAMSIDLAGQYLILIDLEEAYEGNTS